MQDSLHEFLASGGKIKRFDPDTSLSVIRHVVTARAPGRHHDGKHLVTFGKADRRDTRLYRGNPPRTGDKDRRPTAKHIAHWNANKGSGGWSKPRPKGLLDWTKYARC
jgi:hypothetical protein